MSSTGIIEKRKKLFDLPLKENEIEYWGPINYDFSDSFLNMADAFLSNNPKLSSIKRKKFFTAFVELVQNIAKYNETETERHYEHAFVNLKMLDNKVLLKTANQIDANQVEEISKKFNAVFAISKTELPDSYKSALIEGKSLGLIMVRSLEDATLDWEIVKVAGNNWLIFKLQMNYEKT